jgi:TatD DNase family protein
VTTHVNFLVDTHCHLDSYTNDIEIGEVVARASSVGVRLIVNAGVTVESSRRCVELTDVYPEVYAGVGIHPMDLTVPVDESVYAQLHELATSTDKVIVISEIGLDFMDNMPDRAMQYQAFREQIRLAREFGLPIVFHSREAHTEVLQVLRDERAYEVGGAMHYFQGDLRTAQEAINLGFFVSLARPLLRLPHLQDVAARLPLQNIVLETDAAPQPFKAKRENWTEPRHLKDISEKLAELKGIEVEEVREVTTKNFFEMLGARGKAVRSNVDVQSRG